MVMKVLPKWMEIPRMGKRPSKGCRARRGFHRAQHYRNETVTIMQSLPARNQPAASTRTALSFRGAILLDGSSTSRVSLLTRASG